MLAEKRKDTLNILNDYPSFKNELLLIHDEGT